MSSRIPKYGYIIKGVIAADNKKMAMNMLQSASKSLPIEGHLGEWYKVKIEGIK